MPRTPPVPAHANALQVMTRHRFLKGLGAAATLRTFRALGFEYFITVFPYKQDCEMLQRFAETVIPLLH